MSETTTTVKTCKKKVKTEFGELVECGRTLKGECVNRREHVLPFRTGHCAVGACEGKQAKGSSGRVLKPCRDWKHCPCKCHAEIDSLYAMVQKPREYKDLSGYEPEPNHFWMPSLEERAAMHAAQKAGVQNVAEVLVESPMPEVIPSSYKRAFTPTPTGRAARGELEWNVKEICDEYLVEGYKEPCTPAFISELIGKRRDGAPPSSGAVNAVFERWVKIGFATIEKKPTRFVGYTPDGVRLGLDALKLRAKDGAKAKPSSAQVLRRK